MRTLQIGAVVSLMLLGCSGSGTAGPTGPAGATGPQGPAGSEGPAGTPGTPGAAATVAGDAGLAGTGAATDPLRVAFAGTGTANTVARSDHDHGAAYLARGSNLLCGGGQKVTGIDSVTGNVTCGADATATAGTGLTTSGTALSLDPASANIFTAPQTFDGGVSSVGYAFTVPRAEVVSVPAASFHPWRSGVTYDSNLVGAFMYSTAGGAGGYLVAGVNLPQGATLTGFTCGIGDSSATFDVQIDIERVSIGGLSGACGAVNSTGTPGFSTVTQVCNHVVDNVGGAYLFIYKPTDTACGSACNLAYCSASYTRARL